MNSSETASKWHELGAGLILSTAMLQVKRPSPNRQVMFIESFYSFPTSLGHIRAIDGQPKVKLFELSSGVWCWSWNTLTTSSHEPYHEKIPLRVGYGCVQMGCEPCFMKRSQCRGDASLVIRSWLTVGGSKWRVKTSQRPRASGRPSLAERSKCVRRATHAWCYEPADT